MLVGSGTVLAATLWMNRTRVEPPHSAKRATPAFDVSRPPKPPPPPKPLPRRAPPKRSSDPTRPPAPQLGIGLSGIDLGLPAFAHSGLEKLGKSLLAGDERLDNVAMTQKTVDVPARPTRRVPPSYPPRARADNISGQVQLRVLIDRSGAVARTRVIASKPREVFDEAAQSAVRQWQFSPARYRGRAVKTWMQLTVRFELN